MLEIESQEKKCRSRFSFVQIFPIIHSKCCVDINVLLLVNHVQNNHSHMPDIVVKVKSNKSGQEQATVSSNLGKYIN